MILNEATKYHPGSEQAKKCGCTCRVNKENPNIYYIAENCPIHWHINLVSKTREIHDHMLKADKLNTQLLNALLIIGIFFVVCFLITRNN